MNQFFWAALAAMTMTSIVACKSPNHRSAALKDVRYERPLEDKTIQVCGDQKAQAFRMRTCSPMGANGVCHGELENDFIASEDGILGLLGADLPTGPYGTNDLERLKSKLQIPSITQEERKKMIEWIENLEAKIVKLDMFYKSKVFYGSTDDLEKIRPAFHGQGKFSEGTQLRIKGHWEKVSEDLTLCYLDGEISDSPRKTNYIAQCPGDCSQCISGSWTVDHYQTTADRTRFVLKRDDRRISLNYYNEDEYRIIDAVGSGVTPPADCFSSN